MVVENKKSAASVGSDKKAYTSKTSIASRKSNDGYANNKRPRSSPALEITNPQISKKTCAQTIPFNTKIKIKSIPKSDSSKFDKREKTKSNSTLNLENENANNSKTSIKKHADDYNTLGGSPNVKSSKNEVKVEKHIEKLNVPSDQADINIIKAMKTKKESYEKSKPSEISKAKAVTKGNVGNNLNGNKMKVKTSSKSTRETDMSSLKPNNNSSNSSSSSNNNKDNSTKKVSSVLRMNLKKGEKIDEKIKTLMAEDYKYLMPLYENELKKITDVWVNTIYCTLTMRTNLVKLIFQTLPQINKCQFQTEDEKLLIQIANAKNLTKSEGDSLLHFIRTLIANREKIKDQLSFILANRKIAENFNYDWKKILHQIAETGDTTKSLQSELPELRKKKESAEVEYRSEIEKLELDLKSKEDEFQKLTMQLNSLKQKENMYKGNILVKVKDYKEFKTDVQSLESTEKEFAELKAQVMNENEAYEKKIKDLEKTLEEKKKILEKEQKLKEKLQANYEQIQHQQKKLKKSFGKDFIEFMSGREDINHSRRKDHLWAAAVKLVLRGFLLQMNKLEKDRDRLLLEVQSNDMKNLKTLADTFVRKDNFIKSIKHQVIDIQKVSKNMEAKTFTPTAVEN